MSQKSVAISHRWSKKHWSLVRWYLRPSVWYNWWRLWQTLPVFAWIRAAECFQQSDFKKAIRFYEAGINRYPKHRAVSCAKLDLAYCHYRIGQFDQAMKELYRLTAALKPLKDAYLLLARIQLITGRESASTSTMIRCMAHFPDDAKVVSTLAHTVMTVQGPEVILREARDRLLEIQIRTSIDDRNDVLIRGALARYEILYGDVSIGERLLARVLAMGNPPYELVLLRSVRLLAQNRIAIAREHLGRAMQIAPRDPRPSLLLARSYLIPGNTFNATFANDLATVSCRLSAWENIECLKLLTATYEALGDMDSAEIFADRINQLASMRGLNLEQITHAGIEIERIRSIKNSDL